jgi:hypothetical protein
VPAAPATAPIAAKKKKTSTSRRQATRPPCERRALQRLGEQHLLGEDQVGPVVVRHLVVVAHRDRVERARDLAVAAEDAARQVDLVHRGVALTGADAVLRRVLGRHHADAVRGAGRRAQRAADALLQARVLEAMELVAPAEARVDRRLLLGVADRPRALDHAPEGHLQALEGGCESAIGPRGRVVTRRTEHFDDFTGVVRHQSSTTTRIAVTRALSVASGSRIFHPNDISWS